MRYKLKTETRGAPSLTTTEECDKEIFFHLILYLDEFSNGTDTIILPSGSPLIVYNL